MNQGCHPFERTLHLFSAAVLAAALSACGGSDETSTTGSAKPSRVEGSVTYRERMMLPPNAVLNVQLEDISRADALADVLAVVTMTLEGGPPYAFGIDYDAAAIDTRLRYAVRATITVDDQLMFTTTEYVDPFGESPLEIVVERVPQSVKQ